MRSLRPIAPIFQESESRAITTVVHELPIFGRSRFAAMRILSCWLSPRITGQ